MPLELVVFLGVFPAIAALAGVAVGQWMESRRATTAHARTLEEQMTPWVLRVRSPDRMDALVWAVLALFYPTEAEPELVEL